MGADLYIKSIFEENYGKHYAEFVKACAERDFANQNHDVTKQKAAQKKVDRIFNKMYSKGYFRDSYNGTCLLSVLGISYWNDVDKMLDKYGYLSPENAKILADRIKSIPVPTITEDWMKEYNCIGTPEEWQDYFEKKKKTFLTFLNKAIKLEEDIECSF